MDKAFENRLQIIADQLNSLNIQPSEPYTIPSSVVNQYITIKYQYPPDPLIDDIPDFDQWIYEIHDCSLPTDPPTTAQG